MKVILIILAVATIAFGFALLGGWIWMLCLGAFAHIFSEPKAAISYWNSVLVAFIVNLLLGGLAKGGKS